MCGFCERACLRQIRIIRRTHAEETNMCGKSHRVGCGPREPGCGEGSAARRPGRTTIPDKEVTIVCPMQIISSCLSMSSQSRKIAATPQMLSEAQKDPTIAAADPGRQVEGRRSGEGRGRKRPRQQQLGLLSFAIAQQSQTVSSA